MKQKCIKKCQLILNGTTEFVNVGRVVEHEKEHPCLIPIEELPIDFMEASEEELMQRKWKFSDAYEAVLEECKIELKKEEDDKKSDILKKIIDARFRKVE